MIRLRVNRNRIDENVVRAEFDRHRFGQRDHAAFGGVVGAHPAARREALDRRDVDDPSILPRRHIRRNQLRSHIDGFEVDRDRPAPVVEVVFEYGLGDRVYRGVVDQGIYFPEFSEDVGDHVAI